MRTQEQSIIFTLIAAGVILLFMGCTPITTDYRKTGFKMIQKGFNALEETPSLHKVVKLENVKVHIVGHRKHFKWDKAASYKYGVAGYANSKNEIWVIGRIINGKIVINQAILGHELNHLLNFQNSKIVNPDKLDHLEYCDAYAKSC